MFEEHNNYCDVSAIEPEEPDCILYRFHRDYEEICEKEGFYPDQAFNLKRSLANFYLTEDRVNRDPTYVGLWLQLAEFVADEEEVYVYMYNSGIGDWDFKLYKNWLQWYVDNKMFVLAEQLAQLAKKKAGSAGWSEGATTLKDWLREATINALVYDFYGKSFYEHHVSKEGQRESIGEQDGISVEDFEQIKAIDLTKRINDVVANIYSTSLSHRYSGAESYPVKRKSYPDLEQITIRRGRQVRKKYSDLINMKQYARGAVYIEKDYRDIIPEVTLLAYEYEYLTKRYKLYLEPKSTQPNPGKQEFWIKVEKRHEMKMLSLNRKIVRVKPRPSRLSQGSGVKKRITKNSGTKRSGNKYSSSKKENTQGFTNRPEVLASIPKFIGLEDLGDTFECKRYSDGIFSQQVTNTHLSYNSNSFLNLAFNMRIMETPFSMFNNDASNAKALKMRSVEIRDNISKELPRFDAYSENIFN